MRIYYCTTVTIMMRFAVIIEAAVVCIREITMSETVIVTRRKRCGTECRIARNWSVQMCTAVARSATIQPVIAITAVMMRNMMQMVVVCILRVMMIPRETTTVAA